MQVPLCLSRADWIRLLFPDANRRIEQLLDESFAYYQLTLPRHVRQRYAQQLLARGLTAEEVGWAIDQYNMTPPPANQVKKPPLPYQLVHILRPQPTLDAQANAIASIIWEAIASCGHNNAARAEARIGPIGWQVVKQMGSWQQMCESAQKLDVNMWQAQLRDKARGIITRSQDAERLAQISGVQSMAAEIAQGSAPSPAREGVVSMGDVMRDMGVLTHAR